MITDYKVLTDLNIFLNKIIFSKKGSFGRKISSSLNSTQKDKFIKILIPLWV